MANFDRQIRCLQVSFTNSSGSVPVSLGGVKKVILRTSADCYVDFDQPVAPTTSYKVLVANTADTTVDSELGLFSNLYVQGTSGSGTLYLIIIAN